MRTAICLQGHTSGMHISEGVEKYEWDAPYIKVNCIALQALREGYCAVMIEQRYMGSCGNNEGYPACSSRGAALPALLLGRCAVGERVWDVKRTLDILQSRFSDCVDMNSIICVGNSGGGVTTFYAACYDKRICLGVPSCSVCELEDCFVPFHHCACSYVPGMRRYFEIGDIAGLMAERKLIIACGVKDAEFPVHGVEKSYNRAKGVFAHLGRGEYCRLVKGGEGHDFYPDETWPVIRELMR